MKLYCLLLCLFAAAQAEPYGQRAEEIPESGSDKVLNLMQERNNQAKSVDKEELLESLKNYLSSFKRGEDVPEEGSDKLKREAEGLNSFIMNGKGHSPIEERELSPRETGQLITSFPCAKASGEVQDDSVKDSSLFAHNELRKKHNAAPLTWDDGLAKTSEDHCMWMANNNVFAHSTTRNGENIAMCQLSMGQVTYGASTMVKNWYDEITVYDWTANKMGESGHFTQVVWQDTKKLGCSLCKGVDGKWQKSYLVCQYSPGGNWSGKFTSKVEKSEKVEKAKPSEVEVLGKCDFFSKCQKFKKYCSKINSACVDTCGDY